MKQKQSGAISASLRAARKRGRSAAFLSAIFAATWVLGTAQQAQAQSAMAVMQKMMAAYQALNSYEGRAGTEDLLIGPNKETLIQRSTGVLMQYRKPNFLKLAITTPRGDRNIYNDSKYFYVYDSAPKLYTRAPASPTMTALLSQLLNRANVATEFDPLYFISTTTLPKNMTLQKVETGQFSGQPVSIVTGQMRLPAHEQKDAVGKTVQVPASTSTWTWTIDAKSSLLRRVEAHFPDLPQKVISIVNKKPVEQNLIVTRVIRITINDIKPNASLGDTAFHFPIPEGAKEGQSVADAKGGKK